MSDRELVECGCGARVAPVAIVVQGNQCPGCGRRWQRCPNPECLEWFPQLSSWVGSIRMAAGCPYCELSRDAITALRTGTRTLRELRDDPAAPIPQVDGRDAEHDLNYRDADDEVSA